MHMNGWQRLWALVSVFWAVAVLALAGVLQSNGEQTLPSASMVLFLLRLWIVPVAAIYAFGLGFAWVRRGFQGTGTSPSFSYTASDSTDAR